jgi:hypothetical protein
MERTEKLYKLYAELTVVKKGIEELGPCAPTPGSGRRRRSRTMIC